jgi:hypothetical protein
VEIFLRLATISTHNNPGANPANIASAAMYITGLAVG